MTRAKQNTLRGAAPCTGQQRTIRGGTPVENQASDFMTFVEQELRNDPTLPPHVKELVLKRARFFQFRKRPPKRNQ